MFKLRKWLVLKEKCVNGTINIQQFVDKMSSIKLFYSTPVGEGVKGQPQFYVLSSKENQTKYFPAFLSKENCIGFFNSIGRNGFIIFEGTLKDFLGSLDVNELLQQLGAIIEPNTEYELAIPPMMRCME